ncbi:hypothetical protein DSCW_46950 [Desulfosarcina widdelii]|uniref:Uncharacterized protein n=1 Tax=Desulfosarcina widdelii TaxID=947919 RepID=A0A5K7Z897_9BACT|nr:hypothetical protein [Desulfosarcina widdelii]BBO77278.1 hypothetical protein DSCW_46950 [Desulfosarcina widdelii]
MIWHPLTWAFWSAAFTGLLIYGLAALRSVNVFLDWQPNRTDSRQLLRERDAEVAALLARGALACLASAALLGLIGIAVAWHRVVPGAMCGTGVLQAMGSYGSRALIFWGLALVILYAWWVLERLNRFDPMGGLTWQAARIWLTAAPFLLAAFIYSWLALMQVESTPPVSCCAAVYDQVLEETSAAAVTGRLLAASFWGHLAGSVSLLILAVRRIHLPEHGSGILPAAIMILWAPAASICIKHFWSVYYYQVLSHPCPWCLFLSDYYGAGFLIFGCIAVVVLSSISLWTADRVRSRHPILSKPAVKRIHHSAWQLLAAIILFTTLTAGPALVWRLRTGVWMTNPF